MCVCVCVCVCVCRKRGELGHDLAIVCKSGPGELGHDLVSVCRRGELGHCLVTVHSGHCVQEGRVGS